MAGATWSERDDRIFEEQAFALSDDIPNKWERIAALLDRPVTVDELRQRYANLFRDLWLIERGEVTRASYAAAREAAGAPAGGGAAAAGGGGRGAAASAVGGVAVGQGRWSQEERQVVVDYAIANNGAIQQGHYDGLLPRLPGRSAASLESFLNENYPLEESYRMI